MINYKLLNDSIDFYEKKGFKRIESPWIVSQYIDEITKPKDKNSFELKYNNKRLVSSGEQSFLYLYLKESLPLGQFQTTTPCFRDESFDYLHSNYFIKNELIKTDDTSDKALEFVIECAFKFYQNYFDKIDVIKLDNQFDIVYDNIELGSYGKRNCDFLSWIYGTGCAEPRTSRLIKKYGIS